MKNKYFRYVLMLVSILLVSCKKVDKKGIKGREYITESGFSQETTISIKETNEKETTTEVFDIKKHPELWSYDDPNTYTKIFYEIYRSNHTNGLADDRFRIDEAFRRKFQTSTVLLNTIPDRYEDEYPDVFEGDEQMCKQHLFYMSTTSEKRQLIRKFIVQFTLNDNSELSDIKILDSKVEYDGYQEMKDNYPKQLEDLKPYNTIFPILFCEYGISNDEPESVWDKYYNCYTDNFIKKFNNCNKCIMNREEYGNSEKYVYDAKINENNTDLTNRIIGLTLKYTAPKLNVKDKNRYSYRNIIVHFDVDNRNYLDNITKIEEVLEDGTVVEVENNFGK